MIKQTTVLMATPIALKATEAGIDLHDRCGDIIKGLDQSIGSIKKFTEDNIAVELPDFTAKDDEHTVVIEETTTIVADHIRSALNLISKKVKPILRCVEKTLSHEMDPSNVSETIFGYININMVNIEPSFLNSPFYPKEIPAVFNGVTTIKLSDLAQGTYPAMAGDELVNMIAVDVAELAPFFRNEGEVADVYRAIFVDRDYWSFFGSTAIENGVLDVRNTGNCRFDAFRQLVIGSLLLNRMVAQDEPMPGVTGVSLEDYRISLSLTRDLFDYLLVNFRQLWEQRASAGMVIISDKVVKQVADRGNMATKEVLSGSVTVGYNNAVLQMFANGSDLSLSEYVVGYLYAKFRGYPVKDIITDAEIIKNAWVEYTNDVSAGLLFQKTAIGKSAFIRALENLYNDEEYKPLIDVMESDIHPSQRVIQRVTAQIDLDLFFGNTAMLDAVVRGENSLMNTRMAAILAGVLDSPIAQEILEMNADKPAASIEQQRKILSGSIAKVILKRLINS